MCSFHRTYPYPYHFNQVLGKYYEPCLDKNEEGLITTHYLSYILMVFDSSSK